MLVAGGFDPRALATVEWLARRHGVEVSCFSVSVLRFGNERLLTVRRESPRDGQSRRPAAQVQWMLTGAHAPSVGVVRGARRAVGGEHAAARAPSRSPSAPRGRPRRDRVPPSPVAVTSKLR